MDLKKLYSILALLLLSMSAFSQRDFDYSVFTTHEKLPLNLHAPYKADTLTEIFNVKRIVKHANQLDIISVTNTADCTSYRLAFLGVQTGENILLYSCPDNPNMWIKIDPITPTININNRDIYY